MKTNPSRRDMLRLAGVGLALPLIPTHQAYSQDNSPRRKGDPDKLSLGLASYSLREFNLEQTLVMAQRVALKKICLKSMHLPLDSSPEQIRAVAAQVQQAGLDLYGAGVVTMKKKSQVDQAFEYAKAAGMRVIVGVPSIDMLPLVNEKVQEYDIKVAIHNHGPEDKVFPIPSVIYDYIKAMDPRMGICMDIGHTFRAGADPARDARQYADRLFDIHLKDETIAASHGETLEIGRGAIDIPAVIRSLIDTGFDGVASFEYEKDSKDPLAGLAESVGYVRGVLATLTA